MLFFFITNIIIRKKVSLRRYFCYICAGSGGVATPLYPFV